MLRSEQQSLVPMNGIRYFVCVHFHRLFFCPFPILGRTISGQLLSKRDADIVRPKPNQNELTRVYDGAMGSRRKVISEDQTSGELLLERHGINCYDLAG